MQSRSNRQPGQRGRAVAGDYYDGTTLFEYADPDAVHLTLDSVWRVYVNDGTELMYVEASDADVARSWTDAW